MFKFLVLLLLFSIFLYGKTGFTEKTENSGNLACDIGYFYQNSSNFFIELEGFQATPLKEKTIDILGNIKIKERTYKNPVAKLKVKLYWGENLVLNWKSLIFALTGVSETSLKDLQIDKLHAKIYEKENYKAIIFPLIESSENGFMLVFTSKDFSVEEMIDIIKKFPLNNFCLTP